MSVVKYGEWEIDVDIEKTKKYYNTLSISNDDQAYRNFTKYCRSLSDNEQDFFDSLGIDPLICNIVAVGKSKKYLPCGGHYYVYGKYISTPKENILTAEQLVENDFTDDRPDPRITIGVFELDFQNPDDEFYNIPDDMPIGCICINFWCGKMPWLLDEKCKLPSIYPPGFWEIGRKIRVWKANRKAEKEYKIAYEQDIIRLFSEEGIAYEAMSKKEVSEYKKKWLSEFAQQNAEKAELTTLCIGSKKFSAFLWHLFSYEYVQPTCGEQAANLFDKQSKDSAVLIENIANSGYRIYNLSKINSEFLNKWTDVTVTAADFSWTYSKTHEGMLGPYFYRSTK